MTRSASTPRLRLTQIFYGIMVLANLAVGSAPRNGTLAVSMSLIGFVCVAAACLGRLWCSAHIAGRKDVALITQGPYAWCRHPLYAWSLLAGVGLGLATRTWIWPLLSILVLGLLFLRAIVREDRELAERHGERFAAYAARTPAFWPRRPAAGSNAAANEIPLRMDIYRKAFLDAGSMLLLFGLIAAGAALRDAQVLPRWLTLP